MGGAVRIGRITTHHPANRGYLVWTALSSPRELRNHHPKVALTPTKITYAEYLALERESQVKHEYLRGQMRAMAGG